MIVTRNHTGHRVGECHPAAKHSDATVAKAREMRGRGKSYGQISQALGVPYYTVRDWVNYTTRWAR